jgi:hypothetical protein
MTTHISTKLAALGVALLMNVTLIGAVAYFVDGPPNLAGRATAAVFAKAV